MKYKLLVISFLILLFGCQSSGDPENNTDSEEENTNTETVSENEEDASTESDSENEETSIDLIDEYDFSIQTNSTNISVFDNVEVGSNTDFKSDIYKKVPVEIGSTNSKVVTSKSAHITPYGFAILWMLPVKNISQDVLCYISTMYYDLMAGDVVLKSKSIEYVSGSIRYVPRNQSLTNTCLLPGEVGIVAGQVFLPISDVDRYFDELTSISIDEINYSEESTLEVTGTAIGQSVDSSSGGNFLSIDFKNTGDKIIDLYGGYSKYFLLDGNRNPIFWGSAYRGSGEYLVGAGEIGSIIAGSIGNISYTGVSSSVVFVTDFEYEND